MQIASPFDEQTAEAEVPSRLTGPLELNSENVELVLDEMRPYLIADGGNVALRDIDGGVVILELQGACGSCPSSSVSQRLQLLSTPRILPSGQDGSLG